MCQGKEVQRLWTANKDNVVIDGVWLPRQDQLQSLLKEKDNFRVLAQFYCFYSDLIYKMKKVNVDATTWSMEQLWLAFVLRDQTWNGERWT